MAMRIYDASEGGDPSLYVDDATGQFYRMTDGGLVPEGGTTWQSQAKPMYDAGWTSVNGVNTLRPEVEGGGPPSGEVSTADTDAYRMMGGQLWAKTPGEFSAPIPTGYEGLPRRSYADWLAELERAAKSDAKTNFIENAIGAGLFGGIGALSGGFGLADLWNGLTNPVSAAPTSTGFSGTFNQALPGSSAGGALPYGDAIEGLIDLTNKGMSGADAVAALGQINPAWTQTGLEFLMNNPSQIFGSGSSGLSGALKGLLGGAGGSGGDTDWLSMLGKLGAAGLGAYASGEQSDALSKLAGQYQEFGAPSRARYEASMTPGFDPTSIPGYAGALDTASRGLLARLSTQGNPYGSPGGLIEANKQIVAGTALPAVQEYQRLNANTGFGSSMNAALNLQTGAIGEDANKYNALGYGLNQVTQPQTTFDSLIKSLRQSGLA